MDTLRLSARLARSRPGETFVAIIGVALGIGALVGVATLIHGYDEYQSRLQKNPLSREITVSGFRGQRDSGVAVAPADQTFQAPVMLSLADGAKALAEVDGLEIAYQYNSRRFSTAPVTAASARSMFFGGPGGPGGFDGGPQPVTVTTTAQAGSAPQAGSAAPAGGGAARAGRNSGASASSSGASGARASGGGGSARGGAAASAPAQAPLPGAPPGGPGSPGDPMQAIIQEQQAAIEAASRVAVDEVKVETLQGIVATPSFFTAYELTAARGSIFSDSDVSARRNVAVVGSSLAKTLYGGTDPIGKKIRLNGTAYDIIGVLAPDPWEDGTRPTSFDDMVFTPLVTRSFTLPGGQVVAFAQGADSLSLMAKAGGSPASVGKALQTWYDRGYGAERVRVRTTADRYQREVTQRRGVLFVLTILAGAAAAAAAVNLFNIMAGRALKRGKSYGIMRAIGAPSSTVFRSVMAETCIAAGSGAVLSFAVSVPLFSLLEGALTAAAGNQVPVRLDPAYLVIATLLAAAVTVALVAAPGRSAARAPIAEALKSE